MMPNYYFAYGSNLSHQQMKTRCPESVPVGFAELPGYRIGFFGYSNRWKGAAACILRDDKTSLAGGLYQMTEKDLERLDAYESVPQLYKRENVLINYNNQSLTAVTYIVNNPLYDHPSDKYLSTILTGCNDFGIVPKALAKTLVKYDYPIDKLFVYGTLKTNASAHQLISKYCKSIQPASLHHYDLKFDCGLHFIVSKKEGRCEGELVQSDCISELIGVTDRYERYYPDNPNNSMYLRMPVLVETAGNKTVIAWTYIAGSVYRGQN